MHIQKILIAVDDSPVAEKVCKNGFEIARQMGAEIALVSIADTNYLLTQGGVSPKEVADEVKASLEKNQKTLLDKIFKDAQVRPFVEEGTPYISILRIAEEWGAGMLVIGTHGRTGLTHLLLGSVSEKIVRHSKVPVLVIPAK